MSEKEFLRACQIKANINDCNAFLENLDENFIAVKPRDTGTVAYVHKITDRGLVELIRPAVRLYRSQLESEFNKL